MRGRSVAASSAAPRRGWHHLNQSASWSPSPSCITRDHPFACWRMYHAHVFEAKGRRTPSSGGCHRLHLRRDSGFVYLPEVKDSSGRFIALSHPIHSVVRSKPGRWIGNPSVIQGAKWYKVLNTILPFSVATEKVTRPRSLFDGVIFPVTFLVLPFFWFVATPVNSTAIPATSRR